MKNNRTLLSIIVPCFNESKVLDTFHKEMMEQMDMLNSDYDYEIIYVNDGSTDDTQRKITSFSAGNNSVKYLSFSRNFGKESAMLAGLEYASGDCAVILDADLQHPPELIHQMVEKYEEGYDQVIAKRNRAGDSLRNRFFARSYYKLVKNMVDVKMTDGAGDFRLLSRAAINAVLSLKETNRFSKGLFSWVGFNQTYIEYENRKRAADGSRWSFNKLLKYGIDGVISFNTQPLRLCVYLGGILLVISMAYLVYLFISILINGIDVPGYFSTIALISVVGAVQLISLGIIGEYVGRIYAEVKKRPLYIIADTNIQEGPENEG
jgi:glycosyltransferase involved in cell wall biosynthesis